MLDVAPAFAQNTFDPLTIGVGARALGMGKAYIAVAENADTIFNNPAGLGEADAFELLSMSANVLEDVNYSLLGGIYPMGEQSAIGIGYVRASVGGIEVRNSAGTLQKTTSFSNSVTFLSYGRRVNEYFSWGLNLKYYSQNGYDVGTASGSGWNMDLGLLQQGIGCFSFGLVGQNLISSNKISSNAANENLPLSIKVGTRCFLLGEEFKAAFYSPWEVSIAADADLSLQAATPTTTHSGIEFSPNSYLTLRAGIDQDRQDNVIANNLTYGASLHFAGVGFHYAYHAYGDLPGNANSYFSLSLSEQGWPLDRLPDSFLGEAAPAPVANLASL